MRHLIGWSELRELAVVGLGFGLAAMGPSAAWADDAPPVISAEAELAAGAMKLPAGFTAAAVASEPQFANPVAFCFDPRGRIFVAETYRVHKGVEDNRHHLDWIDDDLAARTVADRRAYVERRMGARIGEYTANSDLVRLLEDRDGDGRYEHSSVFSTGYNGVEEGAAAGVMWAGDRLLFACIPSLWELRDADGDGQAEEKRSLASGFGVHTALFGHDLHGLCAGPDGRIYFSIGDRGLHVETPGGVLSNPDSGAVLRCKPDGSELELFATGLRNPQELAFNEFGDLFTVDNNSDSGDRARLVHIVEGMQAGWRMSYQYLPDRGPFNREKIWHTAGDEQLATGESAGQPASIVPPLAHLSDGPSGLVRYPGTGLPAKHDGSFFLCDFRGSAGLSGVRQFWIEPHGATYRLAREEMFAEGVLATDCDFGPDGGLYIADWIDGWGGTGKGRIHRVASADAEAIEQRATTSALLQKIPTLPVGELSVLLGHADMRVRLAAQQRLAAAGPSSVPALLGVASSHDAPLLGRLHAIWGLGQLAESDAALFEPLVPLLKDTEAEVRAQAAKTLSRGADGDQLERARWGEALVALLADPSPRVRCFAAISLGKLRYEGALAGLLAMARDNVDGDPVVRHVAACGLAGSQAAETLVAAADGATEPERLTLVVALGRQNAPLVAKLLVDDAERVRLEAARMIWDTPLPKANEALAAILDSTSSANEPLLRRALAANVALRTDAHLAAVIRCALRPDLSPAMRTHSWELVRQWASPSPRDPVHGQWRPLETRPTEVIVAAVRAELPGIINATARDAMGLVVAAELGVIDAHSYLLSVMESDSHPEELRARAVAALSNAEEAIVSRAIEQGLKSGAAAVRSAARQLLVKRFPERAAEHLRAVADSGTTAERQAAIDMLASLDSPAAREAIGQWLARVEAGSCPPEMALEVLEAAERSADPAIAERRKKHTERIAAMDAAAKFAACLEGGDAERGRTLFETSAALSCRRCHSAAEGELLVGPNLADAGLRRSRAELLESIVAPNAKITEGFQTTSMLLDTGNVASGILRREDDSHAVLVDAEGKEFTVELAAVEERFQGLSAMPEDLVKQMTRRDLRDLVQYLSSLRTPVAGVESPYPPR